MMTKEAEKAAEDRFFLARLRIADLAELERMAKEHSHQNSPVWKKKAIETALERCRSK